MESFATNCKSYLNSKSLDTLKECLKQASEKLQSASEKNYQTCVKSLCDEGLQDLFSCPFKTLDNEAIVLLNNVIGASANSKEFASLSDKYLPFIAESLKSSDKSILISALNAESQLAFNELVTVDQLTQHEVLELNRNFFNRKVDLEVVQEAVKAMASLFKLKPKGQLLPVLIDGLVYCVTHINLEIVHLGVRAAKALIMDSPEMADQLIKLSFYDDVYAQFRHPANPVKSEILSLFRHTAELGPRFQKFVREHSIADRISAFLCHYNDTVCIECINLLEALDFSVKTSIEYKYIITLILHISMSAFEFKKRSFDLLEKFLYKADASQVRIISDEGYIRPFLTLACDTNTTPADKERILNLIKYLIDKFDILKIRIVVFDFDHAHNAEEFSCVNQLMQLMEENSTNLKVTASYILDCLRKIGVVNNMAQN